MKIIYRGVDNINELDSIRPDVYAKFYNELRGEHNGTFEYYLSATQVEYTTDITELFPLKGELNGDIYHWLYNYNLKMFLMHFTNESGFELINDKSPTSGELIEIMKQYIIDD